MLVSQMALDKAYASFLRLPSLSIAWATLGTEFVCLILLVVLQQYIGSRDPIASSRFFVDPSSRYYSSSLCALGAGLQGLMLFYNTHYSSKLKRPAGTLATMHCFLFATAYTLDAHNLLFRVLHIELFQWMMVVCSGVVVWTCVLHIFRAQKGDAKADQITHDYWTWAGIPYVTCLYPVPRLIAQNWDHFAAAPVAAVVAVAQFAVFLGLSGRTAAKLNAHNPVHWTVAFSGMQVVFAWACGDFMYIHLAAQRDNSSRLLFPAIYALGATQAHFVLHTVALGVTMSSAMFAFEEESRIQAERDAAQAELAIRTQQQQQAVQANEARQKFLRYIFHELRVPFNSLDMGLSMLMEDFKALFVSSPRGSLRENGDAIEVRLSGAALDTLEIMSKAAASMKIMMNDTLDWTKLQSGAFAISPGPTSFRELISTTIFAMRSFSDHPDHRVRVEQDIEQSLPPSLLADKVRLQQVISNLVSNAVKFAPHDGTGLVSIELRVIDDREPSQRAVAWGAYKDVWWKPLAEGERTQHKIFAHLQSSTNSLPCEETLDFVPLLSVLRVPGGRSGEDESGLGTCTVVISVRDNGDGLPESEYAGLFTAFRQLDAGMQYKGKGTGLGLAICHEIVGMHGGRVGVRSSGQRGSGAEFLLALRLPIVTTSSAHGSPPSAGQSALTMGGLAGRSGSSTTSYMHMDPSTRLLSTVSRSALTVQVNNDPLGVTHTSAPGAVNFDSSLQEGRVMCSQCDEVVESRGSPVHPPRRTNHLEHSSTATQPSAAAGIISHDPCTSAKVQPIPMLAHVDSSGDASEQLSPFYLPASSVTALSVRTAADGTDAVGRSSRSGFPPLHLSHRLVRSNGGSSRLVSTPMPGSDTSGAFVQDMVPTGPLIRILCVDDVADSRKLLTHALSRRLPRLFLQKPLGPGVGLPAFQFDEAEDGHIAVEKVTGRGLDVHASPPCLLGTAHHETKQYDAITMDAEMPVLSGFVATQLIRASGFTGPIYGCTGNALEADQQLFRTCGAADIFIKPLDLNALSTAIHAALCTSYAESQGGAQGLSVGVCATGVCDDVQ